MNNITTPAEEADTPVFTSFHELMTRRISEILLVSSPYDAYIMQEDGPLSERIIHEYRGLNLSRPPRLTWISEGKKAVESIEKDHYDLVIAMPHIGGMSCIDLCSQVKKHNPQLPVYYFAYDASHIAEECSFFDRNAFDRTLLWSGNTDLLLAVVKSHEDTINVAIDTALAAVRVIIFVEDSPFYLSSLLPVLYREIVTQTQAVMDDSLNEKGRLLRMRTRPKLLVAENYEQAWELYRHYKKYLYCVISDVRFEKKGKEDPEAGLRLFEKIRAEMMDIPLLALSSEEQNRHKVESIPALFSDKNSPHLHKEISTFFTQSLGFGEFFFTLENGERVGRAKNLRSMANVLKTIPEQSFAYHANRNDFSRWMMARFEMEIAGEIRPVKIDTFQGIEEARNYLITLIRNTLQKRQKGLITDFVHDEFDPEHDFIKIGTGSLGGKARGIAFLASLLSKKKYNTYLDYDSIEISLPKTLVITTEGFDNFARENNISECIDSSYNDRELEEIFRHALFPEDLRRDLTLFLEHTHYPLAVRSSAILEDAHFRASAGAYNTYMLPNNHSELSVRLKQLVEAILLIYSSIFHKAPQQLAKHSVYRQEDDKMAIIIQQLVGCQYDSLFYPAVSGVAQSYNYYPVGQMKPEEGIAHIAMGLGKIVVEDGTTLRFSPKYPQFLPQFSSVKDILQNAQRFFYALEMEQHELPFSQLLQKIDIDAAARHFPLTKIASSFDENDGRLRDVYRESDIPIITFAPILKFGEIPLPGLLTKLLAIGEEGMGCPVEIEYAVNLIPGQKPHFYILQIRPMAVAVNRQPISIEAEDRRHGWCFSTMAMGESLDKKISKFIYVKHKTFNPAKTAEIANEIKRLNTSFKQQNEHFLLIGPGRWGSSDSWLGIPVNWNDITQADTIIETTVEQLHAEPSQGTHFFHNLTSLGINYLVIPSHGESFLKTTWLNSRETVEESTFLKVIKLAEPAILKIDGTTSSGVIFGTEPQ